ncbi:MAG: polysaccharide biosynthesis protein [Gammaproteobacteria bacterium CG_4_10_14_0_8_um_filter_38_16]|nr:MAG: polysaccharide biosynthesis protein [Gammaproteobacteria bacterium CG_4_10_14_0_8_um_filter_38_16]PJA04124.1 MAG: polysaccharide biosynthesis protein [Gammaproteobacteria bacterium CG_4_10_14_0_2_um_filter_38_22]PJB10010.1 MAG: polysaccharide biosynthesis protein [Gammaproteobacteria bacterium CG_4_9_14_3_um_filter_38_9]
MINLNFLRKYSTTVILTHDIFAVVLAWCIAFFVRYDLSDVSLNIIRHGLKIQLVIVSVHAYFYWRYKTYRPLWRFFSVPELLRLTRAIFFAWIVNISILFFLHDLIQIPKSIWFIYPLWLILILGVSRLTIRYFSDQQIASFEIKRVLVIGAGKGAELFLRELARWPEKQYQPIASLDDNFTLRGKEIRGLPIVGSIAELPVIVKKEKIDLVVIAIPSIQAGALRRLVEMCEQIQVAVRVLPSLSEFEEGQLSNFRPREVSLEDLLGRDPVELDWQGIKNFLNDQVVLVSGGGGSIGSELCQQIFQLHPKKLIIIDHSEFNLYQIEKDLLNLGANNIHIALLNITDSIAVQHIISKYQPSIIFHAAAYKHVPILESQVFQAVKNNILGTRVLAEAAVSNGVRKFVMVSSDKAVNPTNIMGATKRIAELFCQNYNKISHTRFITVRFGNVIGSTGSVIPLFQKQIEKGGPLTVTHPEMMRYFMTIKEAAQLILQAGCQGMGGEIFVLDMGQPIKILDLAKHLIKLSGKTLREIDIVFTGLRPGEKMYEELFYRREALIETQQKKIFKANGEPKKNWSDFKQALIKLEMSCLEYNEGALIQGIRVLLEGEGNFLEKKVQAVRSDIELVSSCP